MIIIIFIILMIAMVIMIMSEALHLQAQYDCTYIMMIMIRI